MYCICTLLKPCSQYLNILNINVFLNKSQTVENKKGKICLLGFFVFLFVAESDGEWRTIRGKFLAINAASMSCACPRSPKGLSPAAHLADGTTDLILVRKCSRFDFLRHLLRHTSKDDQVISQHSGLWSLHTFFSVETQRRKSQFSLDKLNTLI